MVAQVVRRSPFHDLTEIEALHPDPILLALTPYPNDLGRQTLRLLTRNPESAFPPVLALYSTRADILPQDQDSKRERISFVRSPSDVTDFVKRVQQALSTSSSSEGSPHSSSEHPL